MKLQTIPSASAALLMLVSAGCATTGQQQGTSRSRQEGQLIAAMSNYHLPGTSVPQVQNADANVNRVIAGMADVAANQGKF